MRPDLATFRGLAQPRKQKSADPARIEFLLRQAELAAHHVTGSPEWNGFLGIIQQKNLDDESSAMAIRERLESQDFIEPNELLKMRQQLTVLRAKIDARSEILALPAQLHSLGQQGK